MVPLPEASTPSRTVVHDVGRQEEPAPTGARYQRRTRSFRSRRDAGPVREAVPVVGC